MLRFLQKIGKSLMLPVATLPAAGILQGLALINYETDIPQAGHKHSCRFIACEETCQVTMNDLACRIGVVSNLKPRDRV
ncbi:hypothetical protein ASL14_18330 [Paenibacillus sp. IHB B 3084]|uniref:hypothetical protein n=1 Tax=Paenibacillus sp. IHB B 3084 TaxID=867076 RepID=UPI0007210B00|nr:hypothetical protein [Paenibacillus sp. IHB B 3084]ALP37855.1 hypothetical protein ASL14_18330 [Paenibacillus sp. IHB B 3084]